MRFAATAALVLIAYGKAPLQQFDLQLPKTSNYSTVVFVHGGSLSGGDKRDGDYAHVCDPFVAAGIGCANLNYRLFPDVHWPSPAQDVAAAFARVRSEVKFHGGDTSRIFLAGHSSGCLLSSLLGTDPKYLKSAGASLRDVAGVIAMGCRLNDKIDAAGAPPERIQEHFRTDPYDSGFGSLDALNDAVPTAHVSRDMPRFLVLVAESEQVNPPVLADANAFAASAKRSGGSVQVRVLKDRTHYTAIRRLSEPNDPVFGMIREFIQGGRR